MRIKQAPKLLLSLLLCLPVAGISAEKSAEKPASSAAAKAAKSLSGSKQKQARKQAGIYPKRGMTMKQVRKRYGDPKSTRKSKGKVKKKWPRITVWNYGKYSVYFERHIVLHTVVH